jgi:hypothetical protein
MRSLNQPMPGPSASDNGMTTSHGAVSVTASRRPTGRESDKSKGRRTKIRNLPNALHCSIIGTCLTASELRELLRKLNFLPGGTFKTPTLTEWRAMLPSSQGCPPNTSPRFWIFDVRRSFINSAERQMANSFRGCGSGPSTGAMFRVHIGQSLPIRCARKRSCGALSRLFNNSRYPKEY